MPLAFQIAGQPADPLPSWRDPRYNDAPAVGITPESIWNQAVSEYQWRLQHPHLDVWGRPMAEDTQEALERTVLGPARAAVGLPQPESPWSGPIETAGGGIYQVNKSTGAMRVIKPAGTVAPANDALSKLYADIDYWQPRASKGDALAQERVSELKKRVQVLTKETPLETPTETVTETYEKVPASPAIAGKPASSGIPILHWGARPAVPEIPATPEIPARRVEYKQPHVSGIQPAGTAAPPLAPTSPGRVSVRSPSGKTGTIPLSQLPQALAEGYTRL